MYNRNGDRYDGDWVNGMRHGQGMLRCRDGTIYDVGTALSRRERGWEEGEGGWRKERRDGGRKGGRDGGRKGGWEEGREGGWEGEREGVTYVINQNAMIICTLVIRASGRQTNIMEKAPYFTPLGSPMKDCGSVADQQA